MTSGSSRVVAVMSSGRGREGVCSGSAYVVGGGSSGSLIAAAYDGGEDCGVGPITTSYHGGGGEPVGGGGSSRVVSVQPSCNVGGREWCEP